jgi:hypothetical protein
LRGRPAPSSGGFPRLADEMIEGVFERAGKGAQAGFQGLGYGPSPRNRIPETRSLKRYPWAYYQQRRTHRTR